MTIEQELCRKVVASMAKVAPLDLWGWEPALEAIRRPQGEFLDKLRGYQTGGDIVRKRVEQLGNEIVRTWRSMGQRWEQAGRPTG